MSTSLQDNYAKGGFGRKLALGQRPALIVIDFVEAYLAAGSPLMLAWRRCGTRR